MIDDAEREHLRREAEAIEAYQCSVWLQLTASPFRGLPAGYTRRPDGTFAKPVIFAKMAVVENGQTRRVCLKETLVRSQNGRLLRVERSAEAKRKL